MNKQEIYTFLKEKNIWHEITEHEAVFTMEELLDVEVPYPSADAKNLFIRDDKKRNYYLITVCGNKRVNLKEFRNANQTRPLSFASAKDLQEILGLLPGSVTPLSWASFPRSHSARMHPGVWKKATWSVSSSTPPSRCQPSAS